MALSLSIVKSAQDLLCNGVPKLRVCKMLDISRTSIEKISAGEHKQQTNPGPFLDRYARRPARVAGQMRDHETPLEVVERIEMLLCWYWREKHSRYPMFHRTMGQILEATGVSQRVVDHIARRRHPAQLDRDGLERPDNRSPLLPHGEIAHTEETIATISKMLADPDCSQKAICEELRISPRTVRKIQRSSHFRQVGEVGQAIRTHHMTRQEPRPKGWVPSPKKIRRLCEAIQRTWTREEEAARYCGRRYWSAEPQSLAS